MTLAEEFERCGLADRPLRDIDEYGQDDTAAADARIMAWARGLAVARDRGDGEAGEL